MIEPEISAWIRRNNLVLLKEEGGTERIFSYLSSSMSETFQIVIEPELNSTVRIDAHLIESEDEYEIHYMWNVPARDLEIVLDLVIVTIKDWFERAHA